MSTTTQDSSIAASLRDDILRGQYRSGERLPSERDLAERFGVHRSTVREAFKRLEQLGIADIRRGGARVNPVEEASLDVVEHMLALEDPPNPELVDQTLEAMSGFLAMSARIGTERASDEERSAMLELMGELRDESISAGRKGTLITELGTQFVQASGNLVLRLVRHGLRSRYSDYVLPESRTDSLPASAITSHLARLEAAIAGRDGGEASEAILQITAAMRQHMRETLEREREASARPDARLEDAR